MTVQIWMQKNRVKLRSPWYPGVAVDCKRVAGHNYSETTGTWSYPLNMHTLRSLRAVFGDELAPSPELWAWAQAEQRRERRLRGLAGRDDAALIRVPQISPTLALAMAGRTYQRVAARYGAVAESFLLADEPGLGKTAEILGVLMEADAWEGSHLIVAPKSSLESVWARQVGMWSYAEVVAMPEGRAQREKAWEDFLERDSPRFLAVNLAMVRRQYGHWCKVCEFWEEKLPKPKRPLEHHLENHKTKRMVMSEDWPEILNHPWKSVILDESHKALSAYTPANITQQTQGLLDLKREHSYALTGTPLRGHERKIWGTFDWLGLPTGGYWSWVTEFFDWSDNGFGKEVHGLAPEAAEAFYAQIDRYVLRRTRSEVRADLPTGQRYDEFVEMTPKHRKQYEEFVEMGETALTSGLVSSRGVLSELTRLQQMAFGIWHDPDKTGHLVPLESPTIPWIVEFLDARGVTGDMRTEWLPEEGSAYKYVIASSKTEILDFVHEALEEMGIMCLKVSGDVTGKRRTVAQKLFQSDDTDFRVMMVSTTAGGESIELDAWCDEMIILDETYVADDQVQLEGRINNRSGRIAPRSWYYLRVRDTVQQTIAENNVAQQDLQHRLLDKRRGVDFALHLVRGSGTWTG